MPYTSIRFYEAGRFGTWHATTRDGVVVVSKREGRWSGSWPEERPWIEIPGARDLTMRECSSGWTRQRRQLGAHYVLVDREWAERLHPVRLWCSKRAESSIADTSALWLPLAVWVSDRDDHLPIPYIPEYDEPAEDLKRVAATERACREATVRLGEAREMRARALRDAASRRSRRRIAETAGISFARVQQLVGHRRH